MAWFGEGFSSLKGQLSNFTKDVATNIVGLSPLEVSDSEGSPSCKDAVPSRSPSDQMTENSKSKEEVARLREENEELRKRLAKQTPRDRRISEEATLECEEIAVSQLPLVPLDEAGTDSFLGQDQLPKDGKTEDEMSSLRSRLRKTFQEKVLMEQNCSRLEKEVALLTRQVAEDRRQAQADRRNPGNGADDCHRSTQTDNTNLLNQSTSPTDTSALVHENNQLRQERAQLRSELARLSRTVQELESQVAVSQDENANLSTGMEELDIQHQEAIEQIMVLKDSTQKRYEILLAEFEEMKLKYEEMVQEKEIKKEENTARLKDTDCQTSEDVLSGLKAQIMSELSEEMRNMVSTEIPDKYFETSKENANILETIAAVEKMLSHTMARVESSESKIRDLLKELRNKDDELQELDEENKTLQLKIEEFKEKCNNLPTINENNEDVEAFESKISALENEISILREVRSNLEVEHSNSQSEIESLFRRLQAAEAMVRNQDNLHTEVLKYKENEEELYKKLSIMEHSRDEMSSEISQLQHKVEEQEKLITELKQSQKKLEEFSNLNKLLGEEVAKGKEYELMYKKICEELENERLLKEQVEIEKEKLFVELKRLESNEEYSSEKKIELERLINTNFRLEEENNILQKRISNVSDIEQKNKDLQGVIEAEISIKKELKTSLDAKYNEIKLLENEKHRFEELLEKQTHENESKLKELKALNTCLTQKCVKFEKEVLDLSERFDALKIENDSKDRKLCEAILEKSVTDKEMAGIKVMKDSLEKEIVNLKSQMVRREDEIYQNLKNFMDKTCGTKLQITDERNLLDIDTFISEISGKLVSLEEANNNLKKENSSLSENVKSLICEVNDKSECILKLTAQMKTLHAEKHSIEDRLRNLKEMVTVGNQTDEPDSPKISEESYKELRKKLEEREDKHQELQQRYEKLLSSSDQSLSHVNDQLRSMHTERQQLIETVQTKHAECLKYHAEIQRLCAELNKSEQSRVATTNQLQKQLEEKESLIAASDRQVVSLNEQIHTLQNQLDYVSQLLRVTDRQEAEGQPASDPANIKFQSEKSDIEEKEARRVDELYESLQQEQLRNKYLQDEVSEQHEKEAGLLRELERLRGHLVAVEDNYTQEMVRAEQQLQELTQRLALAEERAKSSSTAYTSASIRANQQVESLAGQVRQLSEQKDKLSAQLAAAEDKLHKQQAALTNLQIVLEQFQRDKERDVAMENERIRQTLQQANNKNVELSNEIKALQVQLKEAKEGLSAASRLTEQLDYKSKIISELKHEVLELMEKLKKADERIQAASVSVEGKVDRCLVRNLVVGHLCAPPSSRTQALGVIATVLDFSSDDRQRVGLEPATKDLRLKQQSLSEAFIRFLENESRPQPHLRLPMQESEGSRNRKTSFSEMGLPPARRISGSVLKDVLKQDI